MPSDVGIPCKGCGVSLDCVDVNPLDIYSLEGPQFRFVLQCPVGENCTLSPVINFVCCGQIIQVRFSPGMSAADRTAAINDAVRKCAIARLFCGDNIPLEPVEPPPDAPHPPIPPPEIIYLSHRVDILDSCPDGSPFHYVLPAGYFAAATQQEADILANRYALENFHNFIFCASLPDLCACSGFDSLLSGTIVKGFPPFFAAVSSGHIPDGMSVSVSGRHVNVRGTPTTPGLYNFSLNIWDTHGNFLVRSASMNVINIGYGELITLGFTVPAVAATAVTAIANSNLKVGDTLHFSRLDSGAVVAELGTFTVAALDTPSPGQQTITNVTATPGDIFVAGDVASWDLDSPLPNLVVGDPYSFQLPAFGGSGSYTWTIFGALPDGLEMSDSGLITGTPTSGATVTLTVIVQDTECPAPVPTIYWGILDFNTPFPDGVLSAIPLLEAEAGPYRTGGYHMLNPAHSNNAFGWFVVPDAFATPLDTTGFKWHEGLAVAPFANVMNTANYNGVSPPFPPSATVLNYLNGDHLANGWSYYLALYNLVPYRFYIFSECTVAQGGLTTLDGQIGSDTFTLFVTT